MSYPQCFSVFLLMVNCSQKTHSALVHSTHRPCSQQLRVVVLNLLGPSPQDRVDPSLHRQQCRRSPLYRRVDPSHQHPEDQSPPLLRASHPFLHRDHRPLHLRVQHHSMTPRLQRVTAPMHPTTPIIPHLM